MCWVTSTKHEYRSCVVLSYILTVISLFFIFIYNAKIFIYTTFIFVYMCLKMYILSPIFKLFVFFLFCIKKLTSTFHSLFMCVCVHNGYTQKNVSFPDCYNFRISFCLPVYNTISAYYACVASVELNFKF